jgi:YidC/Oxa1 family membrane protein insertase
LESNRLIIAIVVTMAALFAYQEFLQWRYPNLYGPNAKHSVVATPTADISPLALNTATSGETPPTPSGNSVATLNSGGTPPAAGAIKVFTERTFKIETDLYEATLTSRGARLTSFKLKKYRATTAPDSPYYEAIRPGVRMPLGVTVGDTNASDADIDYSTDAPAATEVAGEPATIIFKGTSGSGVKLEKTFVFRPSTYVFDVTATATTANGAAPNGLGFTMSQPLTVLSGYRDYPEIQADVAGKPLTELEKAVQKGVPPVSGAITYAGFGDRYFLAVFLPTQPNTGTLSVNYVGGEADAQLSFSATGKVASRVYIGPKALEVLEAADPALSKAIDLGFWGIIALPFLRLLKFFYRVVPNYGIAIILLTIVVRLVTLPMSIRGQRSMMRMQRLQPQVERIREKHKDDSERLNREMVDLYKRNHVNPLGGCLPMVIQFPVFIGLYQALLNAVDLRHARFFGWIQDLSAPDCLHIASFPQIPLTTCHGIPVLVALMTVSTFLQQWMMPRQPDPSQQKMMMFMPLAFSIIFLQLPAGLSLYYFASNVLGIAQQFVLNREFKQTDS